MTWETIKPILIRVVRTFFMAFVPVVIASVVAGGSVKVLADFSIWDSALVAGLAAAGSLLVNGAEAIKGVQYNRG